MSGLGDLLYYKDAVYININDHFVQFSKVDDENGKTARKGKDQDVGETLVKSLQSTKYSIDEKLEKSFISFFSQKHNISLDASIDAKDTDDDPECICDKEPYGEKLKADGLGEKQVVEDLDGSKSSSEDADVKKGEMKSGSSDSDEDNLVEHVEFNDGRLRRKAIFGNDIDHNDLKMAWETYQSGKSPCWRGLSQEKIQISCILYMGNPHQHQQLLPKKCRIVARMKKVRMMNFSSQREKGKRSWEKDWIVEI